MEKVVISLLVGFVIGFAASWLLSIRRRARQAMEDEFERIARLNMRHIFAEVLPPFSPIISSLSPSFCKGARVVKHFQCSAKLLTWNARTRSIAVPEFPPRNSVNSCASSRSI
jgi:hypothetical protein